MTAHSSEKLQELVIDLLGQSYTPREVSGVCGIAIEMVEAISRQFASEILEKQVEKTVVRRMADAEMDELQLTLLTKMSTLAALSTNLSEVTRAFTAINGARRMNDSSEANQQAATFVPVTLPSSVQFVQNNVYVTDTRQRIVEVDGVSMSSATNRQVQDLLELSPETTVPQLETASTSDIQKLLLADFEGGL